MSRLRLKYVLNSTAAASVGLSWRGCGRRGSAGSEALLLHWRPSLLQCVRSGLVACFGCGNLQQVAPDIDFE
jgi:hypothetical protein